MYSMFPVSRPASRGARDFATSRRPLVCNALQGKRTRWLLGSPDSHVGSGGNGRGQRGRKPRSWRAPLDLPVVELLESRLAPHQSSISRRTATAPSATSFRSASHRAMGRFRGTAFIGNTTLVGSPAATFVIGTDHLIYELKLDNLGNPTGGYTSCRPCRPGAWRSVRMLWAAPSCSFSAHGVCPLRWAADWSGRRRRIQRLFEPADAIRGLFRFPGSSANDRH